MASPEWFFLIFLFIIGAIVGSFLNVVILRTRSGKDFIKGRSYCPNCKKQLGFWDLAPILSYIFLGGKCRYCKKKISPQYMIVEVAAALLFAIAGFFYISDGNSLALARNLIFIGFAILIFVYDFRWQEIPDRFSIPAIVLIFILNLFLGVPIWSMAIGAVIAGGFFLLQFIVSKGRWIGGGDIRLGVLMGVLLGWQNTLLALLIGYVGGAVISLILVSINKKKFESQIAFGTFLIASTVITLFWSGPLIQAYFKLL